MAIGLSNGVSAQQPGSDIRVSPDAITLHLVKNPWGSLITSTSQVTLNVHSLEANVSVIDVYADTFFEEKDRWPPVSSEILEFAISRTQLKELERSEISISFKLPANMRPSSYSSKIYVTSSSGSTLDVPVNLTHQNPT